MTFLEKYEVLKKSIPIPAVIVTNNQDCQRVDYTHNSKNCHHCFMAFNLKDSAHCTESGFGHDLFDCDLTLFSQLCYQCDRTMRCYQSSYLNDCHHCRDCHFCVECVNCNNCFGCVALTHKQYCIFNRQYTKKKYEKKVTEFKEEGPEKILPKLDLLMRATPYPASHQHQSVNCPYGDFINNSKNVYWGFDTFYAEDCGYFFKGGIANDCWDMTIAGGGGGKGEAVLKEKSELCYEIVGGGGNYRCAFLERSSNNTNCYYGKEVHHCSDCFGCVGLKNKKYCILNNQLTKEEYGKAVKMIKKELRWR